MPTAAVPLRNDDATNQSGRSNICCSPLWHGVALVLFTLTPLCMIMSELTEIYKDGFGDEAYWASNIANMMNSLVSAPALALAGHYSQPHRIGRKLVLLINAMFFVAFFGVCCLTRNAYVIATMYVFLGIGGGLNGVVTVIFAWVTDWAEPEAKTKYFAIIQGFAFAAVTLGPMIAIVVKETAGDAYATVLFGVALGLSFASPLYILLCFPKNTLPVGVEEVDTPALRRRFSMNPSPPSSPQAGPAEPTEGLVKVARDMRKTTTWLFRQYAAVTITYIVVNFADTALQSNALLYLNKERHFDQVSLNTLVFMLGITSFVVQCVGVPVASDCGVSQYTMLVVSVLATVAHIGVYAGVTEHTTLILLEPLGSFAYIISISATGIVSGVPSLGGEPARDQGTLLGVLSGFKTLATCVSPVLLAATTTHWRDFPAPFNVAGIGFWILVVLMVPAVPLASLAWIQHRRSRAAQCCEDPS